MDDLDSILDDFVQRRERVGGKCATCREPELERIEYLSKRFSDARGEGRTHNTWTSFHREVLRKRLGMAADHRSLRHHLEVCLGIEVS